MNVGIIVLLGLVFTVGIILIQVVDEAGVYKIVRRYTFGTGIAFFLLALLLTIIEPSFFGNDVRAIFAMIILGCFGTILGYIIGSYKRSQAADFLRRNDEHEATGKPLIYPTWKTYFHEWVMRSNAFKAIVTALVVLVAFIMNLNDPQTTDSSQIMPPVLASGLVAYLIAAFYQSRLIRIYAPLVEKSPFWSEPKNTTSKTTNDDEFVGTETLDDFGFDEATFERKPDVNNNAPSDQPKHHPDDEKFWAIINSSSSAPAERMKAMETVTKREGERLPKRLSHSPDKQ